MKYQENHEKNKKKTKKNNKKCVTAKMFKKTNECQLSARNIITRKPQKIECQLSKVSIKCEKCNNKKIRKSSVN